MIDVQSSSDPAFLAVDMMKHAFVTGSLIQFFLLTPNLTLNR